MAGPAGHTHDTLGKRRVAPPLDHNQSGALIVRYWTNWKKHGPYDGKRRCLFWVLKISAAAAVGLTVQQYFSSLPLPPEQQIRDEAAHMKTLRGPQMIALSLKRRTITWRGPPLPRASRECRVAKPTDLATWLLLQRGGISTSLMISSV